MKTTLLIMAAGIGSRFGTGIKQLEPVDDAGHIIMDYSIHDAIEAGFNHVVFIIRKDIEKEFKEVIGDRIASICSSHNVTVDYAFQDINNIPGTLPEGRTKPWGTGQAVLAAKDVIKTPFIVINADDYYGKEGFKAVHEYLVNGDPGRPAKKSPPGAPDPAAASLPRPDPAGQHLWSHAICSGAGCRFKERIRSVSQRLHQHVKS